jgi:hypothetical protein
VSEFQSRNTYDLYRNTCENLSPYLLRLRRHKGTRPLRLLQDIEPMMAMKMTWKNLGGNFFQGIVIAVMAMEMTWKNLGGNFFQGIVIAVMAVEMTWKNLGGNFFQGIVIAAMAVEMTCLYGLYSQIMV